MFFKFLNHFFFLKFDCLDYRKHVFLLVLDQAKGELTILRIHFL